MKELTHDDVLSVVITDHPQPSVASTHHHDPGQYNDRLLLGFRGTMSEAELQWLRNRLLGGKLAKAAQGQLRWRLPIGYVYDGRPADRAGPR